MVFIKIIFILQIFQEKSPAYFLQLIPQIKDVYPTRSFRSNKNHELQNQTQFFWRFFFPVVLIITSIKTFKIHLLLMRLLKFTKPEPNLIYNILDTEGSESLNRLGPSQNTKTLFALYCCTDLPKIKQLFFCIRWSKL